MGFDRHKRDKPLPTTTSPLATPIAITSLALLGLLYALHPARADDGPFQMDNARWMSFDHYQDTTKRGLAATPALAPAPVESPRPMPPTVSQTAQTAPSSQMAKPNRSLNLPVMPADSAQFDVRVNSTADEEFPAPSAAPQPAGEAPAIPSAQGWHSPLAEATTKSDGTLSIPVRMSFLPNETIAPQAEPQHKSAQSLANTIVLHRQEMAGETTRSKTDEHAACAAIDTYRKHQLEAIQGDQRTLKALEQAISTLGLQKQLGFIAGNEPVTASAPRANATPAQTMAR